MSASVIDVRGVHKRYGEVFAVEDVSFGVSAGRLYGLIGHNGAGKSTLIRLMLGLLAPDAGSIRILGESVLGPRFREVRRRIGYLPENVSLYDNLTGSETLRFYADMKSVDPRACAPLLERLQLTHAAHRPVRTYSKGMRQRLGFAQALLGDPRVLFLDEPTSGLDPEGIREFYRMLQNLKQQGVTVLLSSHNLAQLQDRVDGLALIRGGRLQAAGTIHELREALNLPVRIHAAWHSRIDGSPKDLLGGFPGCTIDMSRDGECTISCPQRDKVGVLSALLAADHAPGDLRVQEPSLEDVFLGYSTAPEENDNAPV
ncbi:MAG: putative ABC transporter ATP-binding protein NosF [Gammaproteobacteria bacterium]|nr:putative ABC transporter ATP-binding protein NosF [Gammaproteobacteria bacterium]